jgi:hypothetical protein
MSKRTLQITSAVLAAIPVATGIVGMFGINDPLYASAGLPASALLDTNLRFFSGVWFGVGAAMYWIIPSIDRQTLLFRVLWGMIFVGGIGRLLSMLMLAVPPVPFIGFTVLELAGAPLMVFWQARLAKGAGRAV